MKGLVLAAVFAASPGEGKGPHLAQDSWWGKDKIQHLALSFVLHSMAYSYLRTTLGREDARWVSLGIVLGLGLGKEVWDLHRTGFSVRDLCYDLAGAMGAAAFP